MNFQFKNFQKLFIFTLLFFGIFGLAESSLAACTGASPIWTSTPDYESISSCVNSAKAEDIIKILAGSATWNAPTTNCPNSSHKAQLCITKGVQLIGNGATNTIITSSAASIINYAPSAENRPYNYKFRVSGFTFDMAGVGKAIELISVPNTPNTKQTNIRIDNNIFQNSTTGGAGIENFGMFGVIDHNTFIELPLPIRSWGDLSGSVGLWNWQNYPELVFGTANDNMYIEDNIIVRAVGSRQIVTDGDQGARYVLRYNTMSVNENEYYSMFDMHGGRMPPLNGVTIYGTMGAEIYGNTITDADGNGYGRWGGQRGGRLVQFYNNWTTTKSVSNQLYKDLGCNPGSDPIYSAQFHNNSYYWNNRKNLTSSVTDSTISSDTCADHPLVEGSSFWDDTTNNGVRCGTLAAIPVTCTVGQGYWATDQSCSDLTGMVGVNPTTPISGTLYKCTDADTWKEFYTPYTYPHPLRAYFDSLEVDTTPPAPPSGLTVN